MLESFLNIVGKLISIVEQLASHKAKRREEQESLREREIQRLEADRLKFVEREEKRRERLPVLSLDDSTGFKELNGRRVIQLVLKNLGSATAYSVHLIESDSLIIGEFVAVGQLRDRGHVDVRQIGPISPTVLRPDDSVSCLVDLYPSGDDGVNRDLIGQFTCKVYYKDLYDNSYSQSCKLTVSPTSIVVQGTSCPQLEKRAEW